jgi:hypothetical protein
VSTSEEVKQALQKLFKPNKRYGIPPITDEEYAALYADALIEHRRVINATPVVEKE